MIYHELWLNPKQAGSREIAELKELIVRARGDNPNLLLQLFKESSRMGMLHDFGEFLTTRYSNEIEFVMDHLYALKSKTEDVLDFIWWIRMYSHDWAFQGLPPLTVEELMRSPEEHLPEITISLDEVVGNEDSSVEDRYPHEDSPVECSLKEAVRAMISKDAPPVLKKYASIWEWPGVEPMGGGMGWIAWGVRTRPSDAGPFDDFVSYEAYIRPDREVTEDEWDQLKKWAGWK